MEITKNSIIGDVLDKYPETAEAFFSIGMHCLGCPASRGETIEEACMVHAQMPMSLLMFSIRLQTNNLSVYHIRAERID